MVQKQGSRVKAGCLAADCWLFRYRWVLGNSRTRLLYPTWVIPVGILITRFIVHRRHYLRISMWRSCRPTNNICFRFWGLWYCWVSYRIPYLSSRRELWLSWSIEIWLKMMTLVGLMNLRSPPYLCSGRPVQYPLRRWSRLFWITRSWLACRTICGYSGLP